MTDLAWSLVATAVGTAVGVAVGGLITYRVAKVYYQKASNDLEREANELRQETEDVRHYINALITYLEAAGAIRVVRDENGRPIKTQFIRLSATSTLTSSASAKPTVTHQEPSETDPDHEDRP